MLGVKPREGSSSYFWIGVFERIWLPTIPPTFLVRWENLDQLFA